MSFPNQTILITGASLGVGRACARAFHGLGANVVLLARTEGPLRELQEELGLDRTLVLPADVSDSGALVRAIEQSVARFGALHGLVNNAGAHARGPLEEQTPEDLATMVDVNLRGPVVLTRLALPHLRRTSGFVVNVCSLAGKVPLDGAVTYSATKWGLRTFSFALAEEVRGSGLRIAAVSPGPIETGFILEDLDQVADITFSQAMCSPEDVATMVLASAKDGRKERDFPVLGGKLATLAYLFPFLRTLLRPALEASGRRRKRALMVHKQR